MFDVLSTTRRTYLVQLWVLIRHVVQSEDMYYWHQYIKDFIG